MKLEGEKVFATTKQIEKACDKIFDKFDTVRAVAILEKWASSNFDLTELKRMTDIDIT